MSGDLPRGSIVELSALRPAGKTTLALQIVAHAPQAGAPATWIDAEPHLRSGLGGRLCVTSRHALRTPESAEQALEMTRQLAVSGAVDLIVLDSAAALVPRLELETSLGKTALVCRAGCWHPACVNSAAAARSGVVILVLNQTRGGGENEVSAGGPGLKLYAAVRILLEPAAGGVRFRTVKNKVSAPFATGELQWGSARGIRQTAVKRPFRGRRAKKPVK